VNSILSTKFFQPRAYLGHPDAFKMGQQLVGWDTGLNFFAIGQNYNVKVQEIRSELNKAGKPYSSVEIWCMENLIKVPVHLIRSNVKKHLKGDAVLTHKLENDKDIIELVYPIFSTGECLK